MSPEGTVQPRTLSTTCCIAGGGPAGMMLGYLLARAGIDVVVLEKHADFLRDFRGDTIHPSTLQVMDELGLLKELLQRPHNPVRKLQVQVGETPVTVANFSFLPPGRDFIAMMPQWDFLDFLAAQARRYPNFHLIMQANVIDLIEAGGRVAGVRATTPQGPLEVRARLVVGCDGRNSTVRAKGGFEIEDIGAPIDVFWMRISRRPDEPGSGGRIDAGSFFAMLDRGDYWQLAYVIPKGAAERIELSSGCTHHPATSQVQARNAASARSPRRRSATASRSPASASAASGAASSAAAGASLRCSSGATREAGASSSHAVTAAREAAITATAIRPSRRTPRRRSRPGSSGAAARTKAGAAGRM